MGNPPHLVNLPLPVHIQITHPSEPVLLKSHLLQEAFLTIPASSPPGLPSLPFTGPSHRRLPGGHNRVANTPMRGQCARLTRSVTLSQCLASGGLSSLTYKVGMMEMAGLMSWHGARPWISRTRLPNLAKSLQRVLLGWLLSIWSRISGLRARNVFILLPFPGILMGDQV